MAENDSQPDEEEVADSFGWRVHPVVERPLQGVLLIGIIGFSGWFFWDVFGQFYGIFSITALTLAMVPYFLPTKYELDEEGIEITSLFVVRHFRRWSEFRNFYHHNVGVHLSTFAQPSRLDAFRGNFIRFGTDNRERVIAFLDEHIKRRRWSEEAEDEA